MLLQRKSIDHSIACVWVAVKYILRAIIVDKKNAVLSISERH